VPQNGNGTNEVAERIDVEGADLLLLAGVNDANLNELAKQSGARIVLRGDALTLRGTAENVERAAQIARRMVEAAKQRLTLDPDDVLRFALDGTRDGPAAEDRIVLPGLRRAIQPRTGGQAEYLRLIADNDIVVGIGPAGTGKTYLAVAAAVDALAK
jgi:phosphate starvation-inducible PhoH-like protein